MSFLRVGDHFAYDPRTLHPLEYEWADERSVDEIAGFSVRLGSQAGAHEHEETDRRVTRSMAMQLAGNPARLNRIMDALVAAGVWTPDGTGWKLENDTGYLHLLAQDEIDRQRARGTDERNLKLTVPAKLRDGDNCRYCGREVNWSDRKSLQGATWEHVDITVQPTPLHLFVVSCFGCNREPSNRPPLQPPPAKPRHSNVTKEFIKKHLKRMPTPTQALELYPSLRTWPLEIATEGQRPGTESAATGLRPAPGNATDSQRTSGQENAAQDGAQRPENDSENADATEPPEDPPEASQPGSGGSEQIGGLTDPDPPGRDGKGSSGSSHASPASAMPAPGTPQTSSPPPKPKSNRSRRAKPKPTRKEP